MGGQISKTSNEKNIAYLRGNHRKAKSLDNVIKLKTVKKKASFCKYSRHPQFTIFAYNVTKSKISNSGFSVCLKSLISFHISYRTEVTD